MTQAETGQTLWSNRVQLLLCALAKELLELICLFILFIVSLYYFGLFISTFMLMSVSQRAEGLLPGSPPAHAQGLYGPALSQTRW